MLSLCEISRGCAPCDARNNRYVFNLHKITTKIKLCTIYLNVCSFSSFSIVYFLFILFIVYSLFILFYCLFPFYSSSESSSSDDSTSFFLDTFLGGETFLTVFLTTTSSASDSESESSESGS